jgi:hypothetical protein
LKVRLLSAGHSWDVDDPPLSEEEAECLIIDAWLVSRARRCTARNAQRESSETSTVPADARSSFVLLIATK